MSCAGAVLSQPAKTLLIDPLANKSPGEAGGLFRLDLIAEWARPAYLPVEQPTKFEMVIKLENRQDARYHDPTVAAPSRGRGDPVVLWMSASGFC